MLGGDVMRQGQGILPNFSCVDDGSALPTLHVGSFYLPFFSNLHGLDVWRAFFLDRRATRLHISATVQNALRFQPSRSAMIHFVGPNF
jgi:hypothetical protein